MEGILFFIGGRLYTWFELLWRGRTHWTMFLVGGLCFVIIGLINEYQYTWDMPLARQAIVSAVIITCFEFVAGCIVNLWLGWDIWDYSDLPFNLFGQICLYYFFLWIPLSILGILLDDWLRYLFYRLFHKIFPLMEKRERPQYRLF